MHLSRQLLTLGRYFARATDFSRLSWNSTNALLRTSYRAIVQREISTNWDLRRSSVQEASSALISDATPQHEKEMLKVEWDKGDFDMYPYIWLRDNCQCPECFHISSKARLILVEDLTLSVKPTNLKVTNRGDVKLVEIEWSDGHTGLYPSSWLKERSFKESQRTKREKQIKFQRTFWGSEKREKILRASYSDVLENDEALVKFLQELEESGLVIISEAPCHPGVVSKLSQRVGFFKRTHYGEIYSVKQRTDANNLAYTSRTLNVHVDLPYLQYKAGVQLLHCISQATGEGGTNELVDSIHVAHQLKNLFPKKYDILTNTLIYFTDEGIDADLEFDAVNQDPLIALDQSGEVRSINFNQISRDSYMTIPAENVRHWYEAMLTFYQLLMAPQNLITYKLKEGEILVFDNNRVLHGRKGYQMEEGSRELEGCYWDWDIVRSRRRVITKKLCLN